MSDAQRKINDEQNMERMNQQFQQKFNRFFSLSSAEQKAALDKDIDRVLKLLGNLEFDQFVGDDFHVFSFCCCVGLKAKVIPWMPFPCDPAPQNAC